MVRNLFKLVLISLLLISSFANSAPANFEQAKVEIKKHVFFDQNKGGVNGTLYCGCDWNWVGRSAGRVDHKSCGYQVRADSVRAARTEIEHILPVSWFSNQRQCWKEGGRSNCRATDPVFNLMEADTHNLDVAVGEVNMDRSAYRFGMLPHAPAQHGQCESRVDFKQRVFQPREKARGLVARVSFYMHSHYDLKMSVQQQKTLMAWHNQYPVTDWERERDRRNAKIMGHNNPFVTGEEKWTLGHRNSAKGINALNAAYANRAPTKSNTGNTKAINRQVENQIKGNANSKIYHLKSCPNFKDVNERNSVYFSSEQEAVSKGFRKARNCP